MRKSNKILIENGLSIILHYDKLNHQISLKLEAILKQRAFCEDN